MRYNTRIAPSPTGDMHLGTARTAYFNWLAAKSTGGKFILRIDDTDFKRNKPEFVQAIFDTMDWLGLDCDEVIKQSERADLYLACAKKLAEEGKAKEEDGAIILMPHEVGDFWIDEIGKKIPITADDTRHIRNGIPLIKQNGMATYHFACVFDDIDCGINFVIRGADHITNTARQMVIYGAIGEPIPKYAHVGLIHKDRKVLSKRDGASSMLHYRDVGYLPEAMLNFMARLGWGPTVDDKTTKLLPKERMLELFLDGGKMTNSAANMDLMKLDSFNRKYKARQ